MATHSGAPISRRLLLALPAVAALGLAGCAPEPGAGADRAAAPDPAPPAETPEPPPEPAPERLLVSLAQSDEIAVLDPALVGDPVVQRIRVGAAPWGVAVHTDATGATTAFAATAEGLAIVDLAAGERRALVPYAHPAPSISAGEYRPGGLGLAVSPDGTRAYVAVSTGEGPAWLEEIDTEARTVLRSAAVGVRPFDVVIAPDGAWVATIDHDSFSVTVVDAETFAATAHTVAPFGVEGGLASWEKVHYGAVTPDGAILLPVQGLVVVRLDPLTGETTSLPSAANSHAHGAALAGERLLTVGTGAFGNADGGPNLSILDTSSGAERVIPLDVPHETVAVWRAENGAEYAAVAGGNTRGLGWDGVTLVPLAEDTTGAGPVRGLPVAGAPQAIVAFPAASAAA